MGKDNELKNKNINFSVGFEEFKEKEDKKGCFEGLLVNYNHKNLAHGYYKFIKGSMKIKQCFFYITIEGIKFLLEHVRE